MELSQAAYRGCSTVLPGTQTRILVRRHAEDLREALYQTRAMQGLGGESKAAEVPAERVLLRTDPSELFLLGLTNNRIGVILAALFGLYELSAELGRDSKLAGSSAAGWRGFRAC